WRPSRRPGGSSAVVGAHRLFGPWSSCLPGDQRLHLLPHRPQLRGGVSMTCYLTVLYLSCALAHSLPGSPAPACEDAPVAVLARVHGSLFSEDAEPPWLYEVEPERRPTECGEHPIELVPTETRYPTCVAGHV